MEGRIHGRDGVPPAAIWFGAAGVLPFAGLALVLIVGPPEWRAPAEAGLVSYGAIILSFMGGCRWGLAAAGLGTGPGAANLAISVVPALYAWAVTLLGGATALVFLALGLVALLLADIGLTRRGGAPLWWPHLRLPLTAGAVASLLAGAAA